MACTSVTLGRNESCKDNVGGIKNIYIGSWSSAIWDGLTSNGSAYLESISGNHFPAVNVYKYELKSDANTLEETNEVSNENQTSFWTQTLTVNLKKQSSESQKELKLLSYGRPHVIVEDSNGLYRIRGLQNGMEVSVNTMTGGALGDMSGYALTFEGKELNPAYFVSSSLINEGTAATGKINVSITKMS